MATRGDPGGKFAKLRREVGDLRTTIHTLLTFLGGIVGDINEQLNSKADSLQSAVDEAQAITKATADALRSEIKDLKEQIANGPPGLTQEQADAFVARLETIEQDVRTGDIVPEDGGGETGGGEGGVGGTEPFSR